MQLSVEEWKSEYNNDRAYFELLSSWFNTGQFQRRTMPIMQMLERYLRPDAVVLDAGCAAGAMAIELAHTQVLRVDAVDFSATALQFAQSNAVQHGVSDKITFIESTVESISVPANSYDVIVAADVIEHIVEPIIFLKEMWRICRPGGVMLVETPNTLFRQHPWYARIDRICDLLRLPKSRNLFAVASQNNFDRYHVSLLSWTRLSQLLREAGWNVIDERMFGWWMQPGAADTMMNLLAKAGKLANWPIRYYGDTDMLIVVRKPVSADKREK